jgi:HPt (histidine-containing phosphotransfer) domain-containing protein
MDTIVDFSYLEEMAEGKKEFTQQVLTIFMDNTPKGIEELKTLVAKKAIYDKIQKQAHFLKSSFGIVKVEGMHERLQQMESIAREKKDRKAIDQLMQEITAIFEKAEPVIKQKMESV